MHRLIEFFRNLLDAIRHVRTGGQATRTRATRHAARPARRCGECGQKVQHSPDWRDHVGGDDCQSHGWRGGRA